MILIENRTGQFISTGMEISNFWNFLSEEYSYLEEKIGIVLDVQQLFTVTKNKFMSKLGIIPIEAIKGFHIHYRHRVPDLSNEILWKQVFDRISTIEDDIIINPENHHENRMKDAIKFCEEGIKFTCQKDLGEKDKYRKCPNSVIVRTDSTVLREISEVWVNVDKPTKKCTIHTSPDCQYVINKRGTPYKGVRKLKRDGGWVSFSTFTDAKNYCETKYRDYFINKHC